MATQGTRWMVRRSTDLLPGLLRLAWAEWRHGSPLAPSDTVRSDGVPGQMA